MELSGPGTTPLLTLAFGLVHEAQLAGEPAAFIALPGSTFYPPDVVAGGVDLEALAVVRAKDALRAARAADQLARSGAFGLLVLDLGRAELPLAALSRLAGLAQKHDTAILCLTRKHGSAPSLGSLVSLRGEAARWPSGGGRFTCQLEVVKDKRRGPGARCAEVCRGPDGLR